MTLPGGTQPPTTAKAFDLALPALPSFASSSTSSLDLPLPHQTHGASSHPAFPPCNLQLPSALGSRLTCTFFGQRHRVFFPQGLNYSPSTFPQYATSYLADCRASPDHPSFSSDRQPWGSLFSLAHQPHHWLFPRHLRNDTPNYQQHVC